MRPAARFHGLRPHAENKIKKQLTSKVVIGLAALLMTGSGGINPSFAALPATPAQEPKKVFDAHDTGAVSYTHLDVYKRQVERGINECAGPVRAGPDNPRWRR